MGESCIFCAIVLGQAEASFIGSTSRTVAFLDIRPVAVGHTLVIPRRHVDGLAGLADEEGAEMLTLARHVGGAQRDLGLADGVNLLFADGEVAGQEVFHAHLHVIPRRRADRVRFEVDYPSPPERRQLHETAALLRSGLPLGPDAEPWDHPGI